ncbi:MAG: protein phosphatase 2C domain-containing protein [Myxococcota bacterium]
MSDLRQSYGLDLSVSVCTDVGRVRSNNEDAADHVWLEDGSLFVVVADGMGGHEAGEVASGLAVRVLGERMQRSDDDPRQRLYDGLLEANEAIMDEGQTSGTRGMGTTAVVALLQGPDAFVGLVGDSRLYHVRKGHTVWRTLDHTRVQALVNAGDLDERDARDHPESGMLTRALGHSRMSDGEPLVPDVLEEPLELESEDALVMCSDGLHDLVEDWEISQVVAGRTPEDAAQELVDLACDRGGFDNVTVAVVTVGERAGEYDATFGDETDAPDSLPFESQEEHAEVIFEITQENQIPPRRGPAPSTVPPTQEPGRPRGRRRMVLGLAMATLLGLVGAGLLLVGLLAVVVWGLAGNP